MTQNIGDDEIHDEMDPDEATLQPSTDHPDVDFDDEEDSFSLEELGAAYKHIVAKSDGAEWGSPIETGEVLQREQLLAAQADDATQADAERSASDDDIAEPHEATEDPLDEPEAAATPEAIIEAALFVGNPTGNGITAARLASIMRGMTPEEVVEIIETLNRSYRANRQGIRIASDETGYRLVVAPEVESIRHVFTGKVRETRLNQASIEVLSLVAYQPGITAAECTDKRGQESASLLNQMVRRRLIEMKREPETPADSEASAPSPDTAAEDESSTAENADAKPKPKKVAKPKLVSRYYPAERLLVLLGLESLEDLPQVEEVHFG